MLITKEIGIDCGHRVPNHKSKCSNFHGHRYRIIVGVDDKVISTPGTSDEGMVIDFSDLKEIMMEVLDGKFDHGFIMYDEDPYRELLEETWTKNEVKVEYVPFIPTAENLSKHWFELLKPKLAERQIKLKHVEVYETPTSMARYEE